MNEHPGYPPDPTTLSRTGQAGLFLQIAGALASGGAVAWMLKHSITPLTEQLLVGGGLLVGIGIGLWGIRLRSHWRIGTRISFFARQWPVLQQLSTNATPLVLTGELPPLAHREVSALSARITGFPKGNDKNIEHLQHCLASMTRVLRSHQATILFQGSTSLLAVFNAPLDQKDHISKALGAARAMQLEFRGLDVELVLGLHTGAATVGLLQRPDHPIYAVLGEAPELARRLQARGQPGEILLSQKTAERARVRTKDFESDGELTFVRLITRRIFGTDDVSEHGG